MCSFYKTYLTQFVKERGALNVINAYIPVEGCHDIRIWEDLEALEVILPLGEKNNQTGSKWLCIEHIQKCRRYIDLNGDYDQVETNKDDYVLIIIFHKEIREKTLHGLQCHNQ